MEFYNWKLAANNNKDAFLFTFPVDNTSSWGAWMHAASRDGSIYACHHQSTLQEADFKLFRLDTNNSLQEVGDLSNFGIGSQAFQGRSLIEDLATSPDGSVIVVTDLAMIRVRPSDGSYLMAGSATNFGSTYGVRGELARFRYLSSVVVAPNGDAYASDLMSNSIVKVTPDGFVTRVAGGGASGTAAGFSNGVGRDALFSYPWGLTMDGAGNLFVGDSNNYRIRKIDPSGLVTTLAGSGTSGDQDGNGLEAKFSSPRNICCDRSGNLYVRDRIGGVSYRICRVSQSGKVVTLRRRRIGDEGKYWSGYTLSMVNDTLTVLEEGDPM
jgi:hypothetical protein